jgi:hypothetical protein
LNGRRLHAGVRILSAAATVAIVFSFPSQGMTFSGEDPLHGNPWHHQQMTLEAATAPEVGFSQGAAANLAWYADYVDSYGYNPLWWMHGGIPRLKVAMATHDELKKLHFDDLFSTNAVKKTWRRYQDGTIAGLIWAMGRSDTAAAQQILGVSLHAIQDFYSHSSWIDDPTRRFHTWYDVFDTSPTVLDQMTVWTGSYEQPDHLGIKPHGKIAPACTIMQGPLGDLLGRACSAVSPISSGSMCLVWRACNQGLALPQIHVGGTPIPPGVLYLAPPGIALDSRWMAPIGVEQRGLAGISGQEAFDTARRLAVRSSIQWLQRLESTMVQIGGASFWQTVKGDGPSSAAQRWRQYEDFSRFPYMMISVGPYPAGVAPEANGVYLRVQIKTANVAGAGTDADIMLEAGGKKALLDYMPYQNPLLSYNDFERGDDQVYYVGPYTQLPGSIRLRNRAASAEDVAEQAWASFTSAVEQIVASVPNLFRLILGWSADIVGTKRVLWGTTQLHGIYTAVPFEIDVKGGGEGRYVVSGWIQRAQTLSGAADFLVTLHRLHCIRESEWDQASDSDEPFVMAVLAPFPGNTQRLMTQPYSDVDTGEVRAINRTFPRARVPDNGMLSLIVSVMESDHERQADRERLLERLAGSAQQTTAPVSQGFTDTLGAAIAADWKVSQVEIFAFSRGFQPIRAGRVHASTPNVWVKGGKFLELQLDSSAYRSWGPSTP